MGRFIFRLGRLYDWIPVCFVVQLDVSMLFRVPVDRSPVCLSVKVPRMILPTICQVNSIWTYMFLFHSQLLLAIMKHVLAYMCPVNYCKAETDVFWNFTVPGTDGLVLPVVDNDQGVQMQDAARLQRKPGSGSPPEHGPIRKRSCMTCMYLIQYLVFLDLVCNFLYNRFLVYPEKERGRRGGPRPG